MFRDLYTALLDGDEIRASVFGRPESIKEVTSNEDTALHIAVEDFRSSFRSVLFNELVKSDIKEYLSNWKNEDGNTVMHLIRAPFSSDPSLEKQMLKKLLLVEHSNLTLMRGNSIRGQSDLSNRLNDRKVDLELCNKDSGFKNNKICYDSFSNKNTGFLKGKIAFYLKECLTNYWEKLVADGERTPRKKDASFRTRWLYAGTNYRRMVDPIDVAEYYNHYKTSGRSQCYKKLEHSLGEAGHIIPTGKPLSSRVSMKKQNVSASLMEDSCFWAHVEEYLMEQIENYAESLETKTRENEYLSNKKNEDSNTRMQLTTLNKSIEQPNSTMAQEIEVKKRTNNLQAFPVVSVDTEHRQVKTVNSFLAETPESSEAMVNAMEAGELRAVNVPSDVLQSRSSFLANSHLKNNWPMKIKIESRTNAFHLLLLIAALVSTITYHTALKIQACKSEERCNYNLMLISICQIVDQHPLFIRLVMAFNSFAFFLSVALLMIFFNKLPLRPLLLVSAFSMLGAYICAISDLTKPA